MGLPTSLSQKAVIPAARHGCPLPPTKDLPRDCACEKHSRSTLKRKLGLKRAQNGILQIGETQDIYLSSNTVPVVPVCLRTIFTFAGVRPGEGARVRSIHPICDSDSTGWDK